MDSQKFADIATDIINVCADVEREGTIVITLSESGYCTISQTKSEETEKGIDTKCFSTSNINVNDDKGWRTQYNRSINGLVLSKECWKGVRNV